MKQILLNCIVLLLLLTQAYAQDWEIKKNKDGIKVYTKVNPQSPFDLLKAECEVAVNADVLLQLIFDVSKHKLWVYNTEQSVLIKRNSAYDILYYGETYAPWPVSNRDLVIHLIASRDSLTGIYTINGKSKPDLKPEVEGKIRVPRSEAVWKLVPLGNNKTRVSYSLDIDPGGSIPAWLVNYASVEGPYLSFKSLMSILLK